MIDIDDLIDYDDDIIMNKEHEFNLLDLYNFVIKKIEEDNIIKDDYS